MPPNWRTNMKFNMDRIFWILLILFVIFAVGKQCHSLTAASRHYIERLFTKDAITIYCIDGYKWVEDHGVSIKQFYRLDSKGNSVPARCDE